MTPEQFKYLLGALGSVVVVIVGAVAVLLAKAYKLGQITTVIETTAREMSETKDEIKEVSKKLAAIAIHETRIGTVEHAVSRVTSDVRDLLRAVGKLQGREELRSSPDWGNNGHGEE